MPSTGGDVSPVDADEFADVEDVDTAAVPSPSLEDEMLGHMSAGTSADVNADRRVRGAAATLGGVVGVAFSGPAGGFALAAAAAYATSRENRAGAVLRRASETYLQVADRAVDQGFQVADQALERSCEQLHAQLRNVDVSTAPAPLRPSLRLATEGLRHAVEPKTTAAPELEEARRMRERFPDRIPVLCERSPYSDLPEISRKKFAVSGAMLCGEFKYIVHKLVVQAIPSRLSAEQTIYVFVNGIAPKTSTPMADLYAQLVPCGGFLRVTYGAENTLG